MTMTPCRSTHFVEVQAVVAVAVVAVVAAAVAAEEDEVEVAVVAAALEALLASTTARSQTCPRSLATTARVLDISLVIASRRRSQVLHLHHRRLVLSTRRRVTLVRVKVVKEKFEKYRRVVKKSQKKQPKRSRSTCCWRHRFLWTSGFDERVRLQPGSLVNSVM